MAGEGLFPTDAFLRAKQFQVQQEDQANQRNSIGTAVGTGIAAGIQQSQQNNFKLQDARREMLKNYVLYDNDTQSILDPQSTMQYISTGKFPEGKNIVAKEAKPTGNQFIIGTDNKTSALTDPNTGKPITTRDKITMAKPSLEDVNKGKVNTAVEIAQKTAPIKVQTASDIAINKQKNINPEDNPTDEELKTSAEYEISGGLAPSFGMGANVNRTRYQKIRAQTIKDMGGAGAAVGKKTETMAGRSAATQAAKTQEGKVNQGVDLIGVISQGYDPKNDTYTIPPSMHTELALGFARMLSPAGVVPIQLEEQIRQGTGKEALSKAAIYFGLDPAKIGGTTDSVADYFAHSIVRQGEISENLRNDYTGGKGTSFTKNLQQSTLANKFRKPGQPQLPIQGQGQQQPPAMPAQGQSPKPGGVLHMDKLGRKAWVYQDGTYDVVR